MGIAKNKAQCLVILGAGIAGISAAYHANKINGSDPFVLMKKAQGKNRGHHD